MSFKSLLVMAMSMTSRVKEQFLRCSWVRVRVRVRVRERVRPRESRSGLLDAAVHREEVPASQLGQTVLLPQP